LKKTHGTRFDLGMAVQDEAPSVTICHGGVIVIGDGASPEVVIGELFPMWQQQGSLKILDVRPPCDSLCIPHGQPGQSDKMKVLRFMLQLTQPGSAWTEKELELVMNLECQRVSHIHHGDMNNSGIVAEGAFEPIGTEELKLRLSEWRRRVAAICAERTGKERSAWRKEIIAKLESLDQEHDQARLQGRLLAAHELDALREKFAALMLELAETTELASRKRGHPFYLTVETKSGKGCANKNCPVILH
jgi:hypothetical protein